MFDKLKTLLADLNLVQTATQVLFGNETMGAKYANIESIRRFDVPTLFSTLYGMDYAETTLKRVIAAIPTMDQGGPWLAGGALRRTLLGEEPSGDFDIFFANADQFRAYTSELKRLGFKKSKKTKNYVQYQKDIAGEKREIQCVNNVYFETIEKLIASFDFTVCMFGFDGEFVYLTEQAIDDLDARRIAVNIVVNPMKSVLRVLKYAEQGFVPSLDCLKHLKSEVDRAYEEKTISEGTY